MWRWGIPTHGRHLHSATADWGAGQPELAGPLPVRVRGGRVGAFALLRGETAEDLPSGREKFTTHAVLWVVPKNHMRLHLFQRQLAMRADMPYHSHTRPRAALF